MISASRDSCSPSISAFRRYLFGSPVRLKHCYLRLTKAGMLGVVVEGGHCWSSKIIPLHASAFFCVLLCM